ncbi:unnamed protein product [Lathyrus sativus]|nr:unnamed protein product [Lathyrus sativus]
MDQIGAENDDRENEEVLKSNSNSSPNSKDFEEKKDEAEEVTVNDPEQDQGQEKDSMEVEVEEGKEQDSLSQTPATVFQIRLEQSDAYSLHKMNYPEICRYFSAVAWCPKMNAIACAAEACISDPSSILSPPFWIPVHIVIPERPTECAVFNVIADSTHDLIQFIEWSPACCPHALLIANFHGRVTIWTQPSQGPVNFVLDTSCWQCEHEWRQDIAIATKWLSAVSPYRWLSPKSGVPSISKSMFEEKFISQQSQTPARWPNFFCVCSVLSSGSVQLHWSQWPPSQNATSPKWFFTKGQLGCGPRGIVAGDAIITESGILHVAAVPFVNPSTIVVWEVMPWSGSGFLLTPKTSINNGVPPRSQPNWSGFAPLAAYLFSWQDFLLSEEKQGKNQTDQNLGESIRLYCSPVSNFSAYMSPETTAKSEATPAWGSGVSAVTFDPIHGGSVLAVVIVEGQYMSPFDLDEGPSITGWRVQRWESSLQPVVIHPIFEESASSIGGKLPMQAVWQCKVDMSIPPTNDFENCQTPPIGDNVNAFDLPSDIRALSRVVYSAHGGEMAIAFFRGGVRIFSSLNFTPLTSYQIDVGAAIAAPAFSATSCCLASVWHDTSKGQTILKIIRVLPPAIPIGRVQANSSTWEREIAERFWWSLLVGIDWWDAVGCTQSAAEDGIVSLNSVIAVLDEDFHSLPTALHRQQYCHSLDQIKCRLLEGSNSQEVRAVILDMQARLLLDMLGKGIESALNDPSALVPNPWQVSGETLSSIDPEAVAVEPALNPCIQAYVDSVLDLASHFITRLRRYAGFCRTLASHGVTGGTGSNRNKVTGPAQNSTAPATSQGGENGTTSSSGSTQMKSLVQGDIAKISNTSDGVSNPTLNPPISGPSSFMPTSIINRVTFPSSPGVRLIGDCHFLHRLCQLLLFCFFFRRSQLPRYMSGVQRTADNNTQKPQPNASVPGKVEEVAKPVSSVFRSDDSQTGRVQLVHRSRGGEEQSLGRSRFGTGNAGQGYTFEEVKVLFLVVMDLCRRTAGLQHPLPVSQVGSSNIQVRLHYIDGNYTVLPEVVEASIGPHMQNIPRPRGADAAGLLLRELDLNPPAEEWYRQNSFGGPWTDLGDEDDASDAPTLLNPLNSSSLENSDIHHEANGFWPRKRRMSERDAAFGLNTSESLGAYLGIMGSRRDVVTALWKTGLEGVWYKCIRCLRQTSAFASSGSTNLNNRESWWVSRWAYGCPMCGGRWTRVV